MAARRRTPRINPAIIGVIAFAVMFLLLIFAFTNVALFAHNVDLKAQVASADTIAPGADVEVAGVKIGTVQTIDKGNPGAVVDMTIDASRVHVYRDAKAQIRPHGVFGPKFIQIDAGSQAAGEIPAGGTIDIGHTSVSVDFEEVLNTLDTDTRTSLRTVFFELGTGSENRGADFGQTIDKLNVVETRLTPALQAIDSKSFELGRFFDSSAVVNETFAASPLDKIIAENADVLAKLDARRPGVVALVDHGNNVLADLDTITAGSNIQALRSTIAGLPNLLDRLVHFSNGLGFATNSLAPEILPRNGQADGDIGLAIKRTLDAFGECDIVDGSNPQSAASDTPMPSSSRSCRATADRRTPPTPTESPTRRSRTGSGSSPTTTSRSCSDCTQTRHRGPSRRPGPRWRRRATSCAVPTAPTTGAAPTRPSHAPRRASQGRCSRSVACRRPSSAATRIHSWALGPSAREAP